MGKYVPNEKGFTLIEIVATLVLLGIMGALAGFGIVKISQGYNFARQNVETAQKAQVAITRITKELSATTGITAASADSISYSRRESPDSPTILNNVIDHSGGSVRINVNGAGAVILVDNVTDLSFTYLDIAGENPGTPADVRRIGFSITMTGAGGTEIVFDENTVFVGELP